MCATVRSTSFLAVLPYTWLFLLINSKSCEVSSLEDKFERAGTPSSLDVSCGGRMEVQNATNVIQQSDGESKMDYPQLVTFFSEGLG